MDLIENTKKNWPLLAADGAYYLFAGLSEAVIGKEVFAVLSRRLISLQKLKDRIKEAKNECEVLILGFLNSEPLVDIFDDE